MNSRTDKILEAAGILLSVAFVCTSFGLLISGALCFYGKSNSSVSPSTCESIYVSGLIMSFIVGVVILFNLLFCLINRLDPVPEPVSVPNNKKRRVAEEILESKYRSRSRSSASEEEVVINVKKVAEEKKKKKDEEKEEGTFAVENPIKKKRAASS